MVMRRKRVPKPNPRPKIEYPPVETKTWIPPDQRPKKKKKQKPYNKPKELTVKLQLSSLKKIWHGFTIFKDRMILTGHYSQFYKKYNYRTNGYQAPCNCVVAIAFAQLFDITKWTPYTLDKVLDIGDKLHYDSALMVLPAKCYRELSLCEVYHTYFIFNFRITMDMKGKRYCGKLLPDLDETPHFVDVVKDFYSSNACGILHVNSKYFALWLVGNGYFLFDPIDHTQDGRPWCDLIGRGFCLLARVHSPETLLQVVMENLRNQGDCNHKFVLVSCGISRKIEINTNFPQCLDDANLELKALSDSDKKRIEEKQIEKLMEKGKSVIKDKEPDPNVVMVEDDEELDESGAGATSETLPPETEGEGAAVKKEAEEDEVPPPKFVLKKVQKPIEKVKAASVTYFLDLIPEKAGILRASTHQCDQRFSKYLGKQSIANAVSSVAMLRKYKSKYWTTNILDEILKNGEIIYHDSMKAHKEERVLKVTNVCTSITVFERTFTPKIEEYSAIGKLSSQEEDILDLLPALKEFFSDNDSCIICGPLTVASWVENGIYYMFDPFERDQNGLQIVREVRIGSFLKVYDVMPGVACLTWYSQLKGLVDTYMKNIGKEQRRDQFILCKIQIEDYFKLPDPYFNFQPLSSSRWILRGTFSQNDKHFAEATRNTQCTAMATVAIGQSELEPIKEWTTYTLDNILDRGNEYYEQCLTELQNKNKLVSRMLMMKELKTNYTFGDKELRFNIEECLVNGDINNDDDNEVLNLKMGLSKFFEDSSAGVLTCRGISVAVFSKEPFYYYFDSHTKNGQGLPSYYGTSMMIRASTIEDLANTILANLPPDNNNIYNVACVTVEIFDVDGVPKPPLNYFVGLDENRAILRSTWSENDPVFGLNSGKQTIPNNLVALGMTYIIPTLSWTVDILNEVLLEGDKFYVASIEAALKAEDKEKSASPPEIALPPPKVEEPPPPAPPDDKKKGRGRKGKEKEEEAPPPAEVEQAVAEVEEKENDDITSAKVLKTFKIGLNKFDVEFTDAREGTYEDLEETLKSIYTPEDATGADPEDRKLALLECPHLKLVMWKEGSIHYVFNPQPTDECGDVYGKEEWTQRPQEPESEDLFEPDTDFETELAGGDNEMTSETLVTMDSEKKLSETVTGAIEEGHEYPGFAYSDGENMFVEEEEFFAGLEKHSSDYWREMAKGGRACVLRFVYPEDMVKHVIGNTPPMRAEIPYKLTLLKLTNSVDHKEVFDPDDGFANWMRNVGNWNQFKEVDRGRWILRGTITKCDEIFPEVNRGRQCLSMAYTALGFQQLYSLPTFKAQTVDDILMYGDRLHTYSLNYRKKMYAEHKEEELTADEIDALAQRDMTLMQNIATEYCLGNDKITVSLFMKKVEGEITAIDSENELDVERGLEEFFANYKLGLLDAKDVLVAIWKNGRSYYMFDPNSRGPSGCKCVNGVSCITRFLDVKHMANLYLSNLSTDGDNRFFLHAITLTVEACPRQEVRKKKPKLQSTEAISSFSPVVPGKCIVSGGLSQTDQIFGRRPGAQSAPMAFVALAMTLVHNPMFWTKPIIDEIITIGDSLYAQALDSLGYDFNPWEQNLTLDFTPTDFKIGELKANCELRPYEQVGIVDIKCSDVLNLRQGLEKFFEENTHGVIVTEPLTLAVWEEEEPKKTLYLFDPGARGPSGMPSTCTCAKGSACVITFENCKMCADHFIAILADDETQVDYVIRPVEVCVGKMRTKGRTKKRKEQMPLAIFGQNIPCPLTKRRIQQFMRQMRKEKEAERLMKVGRKSFYNLPGNEMAILRGSRCEGSKYYSSLSRGSQDIPICLTAYVMERLLPFKQWTESVIDMVLDIGDQLYKDSYVMYNPTDKKLGLPCVIRDIVIKDARVNIAIGKPVLINQFSVPYVEKALEMFFRQKMYCMLCVNDYYVALFCKDEIYYLFDPHDLNLDGNKVEDGQAAVIKFTNLRRLSENVVANYKSEEFEDVIFSIILVAIKAIQKLPKRTEKCP